jgi:hypothetical protein
MRTLIESCFSLDTKIIKKDLHRARDQKANIEGFINITQGNKKSAVDYSIEYGSEYDYLVVQYGEEDQRIRLTESELTYGPRSWFICDCDRRVGKLYLPVGATAFKCRHCYKLTYELTTFNKNSKIGKYGYITNRTIKLMNMREQIRTIMYGDKLTERFNRFLKLSDKAGLASNREDAVTLLSALQSV